MLAGDVARRRRDARGEWLHLPRHLAAVGAEGLPWRVRPLGGPLAVKNCNQERLLVNVQTVHLFYTMLRGPSSKNQYTQEHIFVRLQTVHLLFTLLRGFIEKNNQSRPHVFAKLKTVQWISKALRGPSKTCVR